jgi:O-succinylbenzoic acid--CoA ligase
LHERFDAQAVARDLRAGATHASLVASMLARVLDACAEFPPSVRAILIGGGPVPAPLLERARRAGLPVLQTYGLTETASMATCERLGDADGSTAGPPMPGLELRIAGSEIEVRGPQVMRGYLGSEPVRGWFPTGDLGELDSRGRLLVHARRTDLIVSGGENVYPKEVEAALLAHPLVREAAVLPAPDERWGQVGVAYVAGGAAESELRDFLRGRLAKFKIPARFVLVPELPRNAAGKVDRARLVERS